MKVCMIGTGYVGLVTGTCLADLGQRVICVDNDKKKIEKVENGISPFYEPGLKEKILKNRESGRLTFNTSINNVFNECDIFFIAVGTPPGEDGHADLSSVFAVADEVIASLKKNNRNDKITIVTKSTVPVGTGKKLLKKIEDAQFENKIGVVSNPEFLREGSAIYDFFHPDRIVIGGEDDGDIEKVSKLYDPLFRQDTPIMKTSIETSELSKYASNAFLATKISFINEISNLCEKTGANVKEVAKIMGKDGRIGKYFLHAGPGYGGSCFPKDTEALIKIAEDADYNFEIIKSVKKINDKQHLRSIEVLKSFFSEGIKHKRIAILGLAFKPNTDDIREASSLKIISELLKLDCKIVVFDPEAVENTKEVFGDQIEYAQNSYEAAKSADALVLVTEWNLFKELNLKEIKESMKQPIFIDLRGLYSINQLEEEGFSHYVIGETITKDINLELQKNN